MNGKLHAAWRAVRIGLGGGGGDERTVAALKATKKTDHLHARINVVKDGAATTVTSISIG